MKIKEQTDQKFRWSEPLPAPDKHRGSDGAKQTQSCTPSPACHATLRLCIFKHEEKLYLEIVKNTTPCPRTQGCGEFVPIGSMTASTRKGEDLMIWLGRQVHKLALSIAVPGPWLWNASGVGASFHRRAWCQMSPPNLTQGSHRVWSQSAQARTRESWWLMGCYWLALSEGT